jgi:tol-pal system protein YbgF
MLVLAVVLVLLAGCVSNKNFQSQQQKMLQLENSLNQQNTELVVLRKEIMLSRKNVGYSYTAETIDSLFAQVKAMSEFQNTSFQDVTDDIAYLMEVVADLVAEQETLREDYHILQADNDDILSGFADRLGAASTTEGNQVPPASQVPSQDINQLTKKMEANDKAINEQITAIRSELERLRSQVETMPAAKPGTSVNEPKPQSNVKEGEVPEYEAARAEYVKGNHQRSRELLGNFVTKHPGSQYLGNATYWIGENYYAEGDFTSALREFQNVISRYPESWKAADSQLKIGLCYWHMGNPEAGRREIESIKTTYPKYQRMDLVDKFLKQIK